MEVKPEKTDTKEKVQDKKEDKKDEALHTISKTVKIISISSVVGVSLIIIIAVMTMCSNARQAEEARLKKIEDARIAAEKLAAEEKLKAEKEKQEAIARIQKEAWDKAMSAKEESLRNPAMLSSAITKFNEIRNSMPGTDYVKKADAEIAALEAAKKSAIEHIIADLAKKAEQPAKEKNFEAAADIYRNYSGPLMQETNDQRLKIAESHMASARDVLEQQKQFQQSKNELLRKISGLVMKGKAADAATAYTEFTTGNASKMIDDITPVKGIIESVHNPEKYFLESCKTDIGKKILVKADGAFESLELSRIKEDNIYVKKPMGAATMEIKISPDNLAPEEKIKRSDKMDKASRAVFIAMTEAERGNFDNAEKALEPGGLLTEYLSEAIKEMKRDLESKKTAEAVKPGAAAKEDAVPKEFVIAPQHITIKADANVKNTSRETLLGDIYMIQDIIFKSSFSNTAPVDFLGNKIEIYIIGENTADKHICEILAVDKKDFNLKKKESADIDVKASSEFNKLNLNKYGSEYCGYLIVIKEKGDKIFTMKTNKPGFQKLADKIMKMPEGFEFDEKTGEEKKGIPPPRRVR